ncbi:MAG TPA: competence/damage-inducible protein A [Acidimicrobiia bacterium]|nr:competence/damage-inducible protein A [Acidimicrobiia bacterium]
MIVEILAIGTELLLGQIVNSNATRIGERLADAGLDHFRQTVIGDNEERIADAVVAASGRADALIITGGLGPTRDDLTREALARAAGVPLIFDERQADRLRERWERSGRVMPESNLQQAERPEGSTLVPNPKGTAPGIRMKISGTWVFALPGVPAEMIQMLDDEVIPFLRGSDESVVVSRLLRTWGESESAIGERLADLYDASTNPTIAFLASAGEIKIRITAKASTRDEAEALVAPVESIVRERLGKRVFGADGDTIEVVVLRMLEERGWTLGTAESATGGLVGGRITSVPGASRVFRGSVVAYATDLKESILGVSHAAVSEHGVVSEGVAVAMAIGARERLDVDVAVAVTGSAGPDPQEQPAGTVVIAVATPDGTRVRTLRLPGDRERVRTFATTAALQLTRMSLQGVEWGSR